MTTMLTEIERILELNHGNWLANVEGRYSVHVQVYHPVSNVYQTVYGRESGQDDFHVHDECDVIVIGDDFFASDSRAIGSFKEGTLYTSSKKINVGDRIRLCREDHRSRQYKVMTKLEIGTTRGVFDKFRISALGD